MQFHKIYFCLLGLAFAGVVKAMPTDVISHPPLKGWFFDIEGLYLEPNNQDLGVATDFSSSFGPIDTFTTTHERVKVNSGWGYRIGAGYHFESSPNDVAINLIHLGHTGDKNLIDENEEIYIRGDTFDDGQATLISSASFDFDAVNLEYGDTQQWRQWLIRTFFGLQWVDLKHDLLTAGFYPQNSNYGGTAPASYSRLKGLGPRLGFDAVIPLAHHWNVVGSAAVELLVSYISSHGNAEYFSYIINQGGEYGLLNYELSSLYLIKRDSFRTVVPGFEAKIGVNYNHDFKHGMFSTEGGYRVYDYIHAIRHDFLVKDSYSIAETKVSDFGMHGVYLAINFEV